jgi:dephospho-CoA kinase
MPSTGYIVGLTGGIGSGKSTVADIFSSLGAALVDTDVIAHALTNVGGRAIAAIRSRMGNQFIASDGALDRAATRERVFAEPKVKRELEAILHPLIHEEVEIALRAEPARAATYVMLVVPLLFETLTYRLRTDRTLLVDCPTATQIERVGRRSGLNEEATLRIVEAQLSRSVRLQLADDVIWNGSDVDVLSSQVATLHSRYIGNAELRR